MNNKLLLFFLSSALGFSAIAQVRLPQLIRDSMVVQRDAKIKLWGWASPGEKVSVALAGKKAKATTGSDGRWMVQLAPMKAGGPYTITVDASNHLTLKDVLIGDVWVCAGQSNMVHQMALHRVRYAEEIQNADYPLIRQFWVPNTTNLAAPQDDLPFGSWKTANPVDVLNFSAVAYFFAKKLYENHRVPIGLINASWGGVPVESMMSEEALKEFPNILSAVQKNKDTAYVNGVSRNASSLAKPPPQEDKGLIENWFSPSYFPKGWHNINIPGYWEDQGVKDLNGTVWYRREFDIPASMTTDVPATFYLGRIIDADVLYVNGKQAGSTGYLYPQRRYSVPTGFLKPGKNLFAIRVTNNAGKGGFVPDKPYFLVAGTDTVDLKGYWQYKVGQINLPQAGFGGGMALQNQPAALYNSMIAPLVNYGLKGFLWYQGESNTGRAAEYAKLQPAMVQDWRKRWQQPDAPFLFVQLPGFMDYTYLPTESQWAEFREAQAKLLALPNTGMAVAIDLGEWNDIHPDRKKEVGERLAMVAEEIAYGAKNTVSSGPLYQSSTAEGNRIVIRFRNTASGLVTNDGEEPSEFAIAGEDKKFIWAKAKIEGDKIIVWNDAVASPKYVRYAWADNPVNPNLYNKEGLPASPFRTDN